VTNELNKRLLDAAYRGDEDLVRDLISKGANVNSLDEAGYSVLMRAAQQQHARLVVWLADHGADLNYAARDGWTALTLLHDWDTVAKLVRDKRVVVNDKLAVDLMYQFDGNRSTRDALSAKGADVSGWEDSLRQLYSRIQSYKGRALFQDLLEPAVPFVRDRLATLVHLKKSGSPITSEESCELYALGRVNDQLLLSFQPALKPSPVRALTLEEYAAFMSAIGMTVERRAEDFSPFFHEIVQVDSAAGRPAITERRWPLVTFGQMLFCRAGVDVRSGPEFVKKEVAETSVLYFAHRRLHRETRDSSEGWGSNSQWRTSFRRDYFTETEFLYNVDGKYSVEEPAAKSSMQSDLSKEQRIELLTYRCWIRDRPDADDDWYPFEDRFAHVRR
jgi:hypothetical protein